MKIQKNLMAVLMLLAVFAVSGCGGGGGGGGGATAPAAPTYTVTYDANTGSGAVPSDPNNYLEGASVTVLDQGALTKAGFTFTCWNTQADGGGTDRAPASTFAMGTANVTLYAKWTTDPTYTVTYDANTGSGAVPSDPNNYLEGASVTVLDQGALTKAGFTFTCWNTQADGGGTDRAPASTFAIGAANVTLYAKWTADPTYTVTYNANTGSGAVPIDPNNYLAGASVTVLDKGALTKAGFTFTCWNTQADGGGTDRAPASTFAIGAANVTLYAKWTALPTYTVTYDANTGSGGVPSDPNNYLAGASVTVLDKGTLTKAGYIFTCWNTQADGGGIDRAPASTFAIGAANVTLYAKWTVAPTFTVTYDANTGSGGVPSDPNNYLEGATVTVLDKGTLTKAGYSFTCWNTQADGGGTDRAPASTFAMGTANVTLYAKWTALPTYTVTYNANTGSGGVPNDPNNYLEGATVTVLDKGTLTKAGYSFTCWNTQADGGGTDRAPASTFAMGTANVILYAKWTALPTYTVTYNANTGSGGVPSDPNNYLEGATVTVLDKGTLTKAGYTFTCWNTQADGGGTDRAPASTFAMGTANVILYAKWTANNYTITFDKNDVGATGTMLDQTIACDSSANLTLCGFIKTGWTFAGWATTPAGTVVYADQQSYTMGTANVTLYAKWTPPAVYALRDRGPAGGWIFYDKGSYSAGWRYLEAAPVDQAALSIWGVMYNAVSGTTPLMLPIGAGQANTSLILANDLTPDKAADRCDGYSILNGGVTYADWFLPSRDELHEMWLQLKWTVNDVGTFPDVYYWSSSEWDPSFAFTVYFDASGSDGIAEKGDPYGTPHAVRAARAF